MDINERIEQLRIERKWSTYRLAKEASISQSTLSNSTKRGNTPSWFTLNRICEAFGITISQFFSFDSADTFILTEEQKALIQKWICLTDIQKEKVEIFISGMLVG